MQCVLSLLCGENIYENSSYLLTGENDRTIRYLDLGKDVNNKYRAKNSYIINTPTNLTNCEYKKLKVNGTSILESNEEKIKFQDLVIIKIIMECIFILLKKKIKSGYSTRNLDVSYKGAITDLLTFNLDNDSSEKIFWFHLLVMVLKSMEIKNYKYLCLLLILFYIIIYLI